ncbi:S4 domain-containing protein [Pseudalkalibacillus salsuginis]|uniref:S4 domain-containing protein n=1 Tax=Pseudalkalibacillus salsuginis TaxID=2910972 RepID=UPI001F1FCA5C|nr:S4 domain-containing protein [Pseudalkalibacillus salsuginis]MCF6411443.1 cytoplasmic protein [Pseudalkalibacillus salsuginis]
MQKVQLKWKLQETKDYSVQRHCSNCGRTVRFTDTMIRRHNANGKNIYRFAIYKCDKNHTWNKKLEIYQAYTEHARVVEEPSEQPSQLTIINIKDYQTIGIEKITITLADVQGKFRVDKIIADQIKDWSRTDIIKRIQEGKIRINNEPAKPSTRLKTADEIQIDL